MQFSSVHEIGNTPALFCTTRDSTDKYAAKIMGIYLTGIDLIKYPEIKFLDDGSDLTIREAKIQLVSDGDIIYLKDCDILLGKSLSGSVSDISVKESENLKIVDDKNGDQKELPPQVIQNFHGPVGVLQQNNHKAQVETSNNRSHKGFWGDLFDKFFWQVVVAVPVGIIIVIVGGLLLKNYFNI